VAGEAVSEQFADACGRQHTVIDQVWIFSDDTLDAQSFAYEAFRSRVVFASEFGGAIAGDTLPSIEFLWMVLYYQARKRRVLPKCLWDTPVRRKSADTPVPSLMHRDLSAARNLQSVRYGAMGHTRRLRKRLQDAARPSRREIPQVPWVRDS
jgi:hypothetical protein